MWIGKQHAPTLITIRNVFRVEIDSVPQELLQSSWYYAYSILAQPLEGRNTWDM